MLTPGLYEQVISKALGKAIDGDSEHYIETLPIDAEEILLEKLSDGVCMKIHSAEKRGVPFS